MQPTPLFINTARGKLVDQPALTRAFAGGQLGGVALDVFAEEPLPYGDPLLDLHERTGRPGDIDAAHCLAKPVDLGPRFARDLVQRAPLAQRRADPASCLRLVTRRFCRPGIDPGLTQISLLKQARNCVR